MWQTAAEWATTGVSCPIPSGPRFDAAPRQQHTGRRRRWLSDANEGHLQDSSRRRWPGQLPSPSCSAAMRSQLTSTTLVTWTHSNRTQAAEAWPSCSVPTTSSHAQDATDEQLLPTSTADGWHHAPQAHVQLPVQEPSHAPPMSMDLQQPSLALFPAQQPPLTHVAALPGQPATGIQNQQAYTMGILTASTSLQELHTSLHQQKQHLNALHASAACARAAQIISTQVGQQQQEGLHALVLDLMTLQQQHLQSFQARQVANSLWSVTRLQAHLAPSHTAHAATQHVVTGLQSRLPEVLLGMKPQEVANTWHALTCLPHHPPADLLHHMARACGPHWQSFKPAELADVMWSAARTELGSVVPPAMLDDWLQHAQHAQQACVHSMSASSVSKCLWATSRLYQQSVHAAQFSRHQQQGEDDAHAIDDQATVVASQQGRSTAAAAWHTWVTCVCSALQARHMQLNGAELVQALSALPDLPAPLPPAAAQLAHVLMSHASSLAARQALTPRAAACSLRAAARLHIPPSSASHAWTLALLQPLIRPTQTQQTNTKGMQHAQHSDADTCCTARDMTMALHALTLLGQHPPAATMKPLLLHGQSLLEAGRCSPSDIAHMLWVCARLQLLPPASFLAVWQKAAYVVREAFSPSEVAAVFWSLGRLRVRMGRKWLSDVLSCVWWRRAQYKTEELLQVLSGLARVRYPLNESMCQRLLSELKPRCADTCTTQQLAAALSALGHVHQLPEEVVLWADEVLVGQLLTPQLHRLDPVQLVSTVWACAKLARQAPPAARAADPKLQYAAARAAPAQPAVEEEAVEHSQQPVANGLETDVQPQAHVAWAAKQESHPVSSAPPQSPVLAVADLNRADLGNDHVLPADQLSDQQLQHADDMQLQRSDGTAVGAGLPQQQLLRWQPLRRSAGRLSLTSTQVSGILQLSLSYQAQLNTQQLAALVYGLPLLNIQPHRSWLHVMLYSQPHLPASMSNHELALVLFSLGCMRAQPPGAWLHACLAQVQQRAHSLNTGMVSGVIRGLSLMNTSPGAGWMRGFLAATAPVLALMPGRQLVKVYSAAVDLEPQLAEEWGHMFSRLLDTRGHHTSSRECDQGDDDVDVVEAGWQLRQPPPRDAA